jgi:hypothetical protein
MAWITIATERSTTAVTVYALVNDAADWRDVSSAWATVTAPTAPRQHAKLTIVTRRGMYVRREAAATERAVVVVEPATLANVSVA